MEKKYNILIVHNYYQIPGGEDTVVKNEMDMLKEHGHNIILYSRHNSELNSMGIIQKLKIPFTTIFSLKTYRDIKKIIKNKKIDIVHVHNTLSLISPSVYNAALHCKVPVVQTIHNFRLLCPGATFYRDGHICEDCVERGLMCAVKHSCYRGSRLQTLACVIGTKFHRTTGIYGKLSYICLTEFNLKKLLQLKQINPEKVFVKPNFVSSTESIIPYDQRKDQFVFVGRLDKLKGIDILFEAWKSMGNKASKLIVCGTGPMENWCKQYIEDNALSSVELMGLLPNEQARKIILDSKALILPTQWYEGFPMSILEAYSVGTPVIGSDIGNVGNIIIDGISGIKFKADSTEDLVNAIKQMTFYVSIHETTYREYIDKYSETKNYERLMMVYKAISD